MEILAEKVFFGLYRALPCGFLSRICPALAANSLCWLLIVSIPKDNPSPPQEPKLSFLDINYRIWRLFPSFRREHTTLQQRAVKFDTIILDKKVY